LNDRFKEKSSLVFRATKKHATNLAKFASIYKITMLALKRFGATPGKEGTCLCLHFASIFLFLPACESLFFERENIFYIFTNVPSPTGPFDSFFAGLLGGYFVFGQRSKRYGKISSVSQQIVIYIFARVALALARLAVKPGHGLPVVSSEPLHSKISHYAWPVFASVSWGLVMLLFKHHPEDLQSSLRNSMTYIYKDCDDWDSLRTLLWHNK
jgi:peroxisomal membrane protein 4